MEYMSAKEAARLIGCTPRWIQMLCEKGKITGAQKLSNNGVWLIPREWVNKSYTPEMQPEKTTQSDK